MDLNGDHNLSFCDGCGHGKHHCTPFPLSKGSRAKEIFSFVHTYLCGSMATSHGGEKYFLTFIDDCFMKIFLYTMKTKFGVLDKLNIFKALKEN
jgi:hypothetical protein